MIKQTSITVSTSFEGFHKYTGAPEEVSYLRDLHRHVFGVKVKMEVFHDDREVEFIMVKHRLDDFVKQLPLAEKARESTMSCEMAAHAIIEFLTSCYGKNRTISVSVDEDGENGCFVLWEGEN